MLRRPCACDDRQLLVLALAEMRVDDDGAVVAGVDERGIVAVRFIARMTPSSCHGVVDDPGKKKCHEMLTLSAVSTSLAKDVLIPRQVHQLVIVPEDRRGRRLENRDFRTCH